LTSGASQGKLGLPWGRGARRLGENPATTSTKEKSRHKKKECKGKGEKRKVQKLTNPSNKHHREGGELGGAYKMREESQRGRRGEIKPFRSKFFAGGQWGCRI